MPVSATARDDSTNMCKACWGTLSMKLEVFDVMSVALLSLNTMTKAAKCKGVGYNGLDKALTHFNEFNS
jgi:hypothetical protein